MINVDLDYPEDDENLLETQEFLSEEEDKLKDWEVVEDDEI